MHKVASFQPTSEQGYFAVNGQAFSPSVEIPDIYETVSQRHIDAPF